MRFRIDLRIFILFILFYFTNQIETYILVLIFAFIHEVGHLIAGLLLSMKPEKIEIRPCGIAISFKLRPEDYNLKIKKANLLELKKIIVAMAGPLTNVLIIIIAKILNLNIFTYLMILFSNLVLIIFNLIPIYPLDGGRILKGILHIFFGKKKALEYINKISFVILIIITIISSIGILYFENIAIFIGIIYLWSIFLIEDKRYKTKKKIFDIIEKSC